VKKSLKLFFTAAVVIVVLVGVLAAFITFRFIKTPASREAREVILEVTPSMSFQSTAKELQQAGVISNARMFYLYARLKGMRSHLRVGEYELSPDMLPGEVLAVITSGKSRTKPFVVPEGYNIFEISDLYEKQGFGRAQDFMALAVDKAFVKSLLGEEHESLEGYLFPETYMLTKFMTAKDVITAMVRRYQSVYSELTSQNSLKNWTPHQILTLASIIEKETGAPQERKIISSVFHNRLIKKMKLQTDPTIIYGIAINTGKVPDNIHKGDLLKPTKYNTYVISGLPPGPISNPGRESLIAAMNPDTSEFLYFVSQNNGTHIFSKTYEDHNKAVRKFQLDPKAREGKSWRDLKKSAAPK
jgi:UPF0755 protein